MFLRCYSGLDYDMHHYLMNYYYYSNINGTFTSPQVIKGHKNTFNSITEPF